MANRVTDAEVKEIINTSLSDTSPFITPANILTTKVSGNGISDSDHLKEIERWLAAHFVAIRDNRAGGLSEKEVNDASETYLKDSKALTQGLGSTYYGQQALSLDTTGTLVSLGKQRAQFNTIDFTLES